jgi:dihydroxyacetone kinase-like protein
MKKIINSPENVVTEMLEGVVEAHPDYLKNWMGFMSLLEKIHPLMERWHL